MRSIGLCVTKSFEVFSGIQFIIGFTTVTPQLMLPLVGDLAPPHRRAAALSIVVSGFVLGILVARLLSGIVAFYVSWRYVYWLSVGLQYAIFASLWLFMPDYPSTNKRMNYFKMLWSMLVMVAKHPVLVQASLIALFTSSTFTSFWTVLTFLLADPPYNYNSVDIGLFALIGISAMFLMPLYGRYIIDRFVPWFSVILGMFWCMLGICIGAYTGSFTVAGPILQAWFLDIGLQSSQVANRSSIVSHPPPPYSLHHNPTNTPFTVLHRAQSPQQSKHSLHGVRLLRAINGHLDRRAHLRARGVGSGAELQRGGDWRRAADYVCARTVRVAVGGVARGVEHFQAGSRECGWDGGWGCGEGGGGAGG